MTRLFAEGFTVLDMAENLVSFDADKDAGETKRYMAESNLEIVGLRNEGVVAGYVRREELTHGKCSDHMHHFDEALVLSATSSLQIIRTPRELRLALVLLILSAWLVFSASSFASDLGKTKRVLILHSFKYGLSANVLMDATKVTGRAIQATMEEEMAHKIAFHSERMDISALPENRYFEELRDAYRKKYAGQPIDLIIAVNYRALNFLINHGEELWPKTPILFCGVEKGRREQLKQLRPNITGLFADARFGNMLDTIFKIHPDTQQIAVIVGTSETERFIEARVSQTFREYVGRADFTSLSNFGFDAILSRVADLPPNSIVLFLTLLQDGEGKPVPENALPLISRVSNVPVYGLFDVYVGHGIVGGSLYSVENRGVMIGKMGVRILTGEKPRDIPIGTGQRHFNLYDWRQLKRWGIAERDLPPKSIIRYRETTFYELYKWYIWGAIALIVFETLLINFLLINRSRRRKAERELQRAHHALLESREDFRDLAGKLLSVQESERRRLAREMHDDLTQRLAVLAIDIGKIELDFQDTADPVVENLQRVREGLVNLSGDIHAISRQLHPSILEDLGLVDAVKSECSIFTQREGIAVDYRTENVPPGIPADVAICIYRIVQEGLRNIAKHADTTQLQVALTGKDDSIHLMIKDQGSGFDPKEMEKKPGLGLVSMQERVRLIQGNISIESRPGKGTVIKVRAPL